MGRERKRRRVREWRRPGAFQGSADPPAAAGAGTQGQHPHHKRRVRVSAAHGGVGAEQRRRRRRLGGKDVVRSLTLALSQSLRRALVLASRSLPPHTLTPHPHPHPHSLTLNLSHSNSQVSLTPSSSLPRTLVSSSPCPCNQWPRSGGGAGWWDRSHSALTLTLACRVGQVKLEISNLKKGRSSVVSDSLVPASELNRQQRGPDTTGSGAGSGERWRRVDPPLSSAPWRVRDLGTSGHSSTLCSNLR